MCFVCFYFGDYLLLMFAKNMPKSNNYFFYVATILVSLIEERIVHTGIMVGLSLPTWLYNEAKIRAQTTVNFFVGASE